MSTQIIALRILELARFPSLGKRLHKRRALWALKRCQGVIHIINVWKWLVRDGFAQEAAQRSPSIAHIEHQQSIFGNRRC